MFIFCRCSIWDPVSLVTIFGYIFGIYCRL